jgi:hypothetical protein
MTYEQAIAVILKHYPNSDRADAVKQLDRAIANIDGPIEPQTLREVLRLEFGIDDSAMTKTLKPTEDTFLAKLDRFADAARELQTAWDAIGDSRIAVAAPFPADFDEWTHQLNDWIDRVKRELSR